MVLDIVRLFAVFVRADDVVTNRERDYVRRYLGSLFTEDVADYLFGRFQGFLDERLRLEEVLLGLVHRADYAQRVFLLVKLQELMVADEAHEDEVRLLRRIAEGLRIRVTDRAAVEAMSVDAGPHEPIGRGGALKSLRLGSDQERADVVLPFDGLKLDVYQVHRLLFAVQRDRSCEVRIGERLLSQGLARKIRDDDDLKFDGRYILSREELKSYFRNRDDTRLHRLYVATSRNELVVTHDYTPEVLVQIDVQGCRMLATPLDPGADLVVNGHQQTGSIYLNLNDAVTVRECALEVRDLTPGVLRHGDFGSKERSRCTLGNQFECDLVIDDDVALPWTARIESRDGETTVALHDCPHAVYVDGVLVEDHAPLPPGAVIRVHDYIVRWNEAAGHWEKADFGFRRYRASDLAFHFDDGAVGVDRVSFAARKGDLVCVMGPSGCGKSTLLRLMNGRYRPDSGEIALDQYDLHAKYEILLPHLGYVPQDDLLIANLTVYENLYFNARLRDPSAPLARVQALVSQVLMDVGLYRKKHLKVGSPLARVLSGGERKRLNIGLELLADSDVLFLDEPTSGLSSKDSERIVQLLQRLARRGKIVFAVVHQPSAKIYKMFSRVILLDQGGKLAFFGRTLDALEYFQGYAGDREQNDVECPRCGHVAPETLLDTLEQPLRDIDGTPLPARRHSPEFWQARFDEHRERGATVRTEDPDETWLPPRRRRLTDRWSRFRTLVMRSFKVKLRDKTNLVITFLVAPVLGLFVSFILRYAPQGEYALFNNRHLATYIFLSVLVAIFLGMTNSVEEVIKDQKVLVRERMLRIGNGVYLASKTIVVLLFAAAQVVLYLLVSMPILELRELYIGYALVLWLAAGVGVTLGLLVSSLPHISSKAAINIVPLILVPQIIFGGGLVQYEEMNSALQFYENDPIPPIAEVMPSRWAFEGLLVLQGTANRFHPVEDRLQADWTAIRQDRGERTQRYLAGGLTPEGAEARYRADRDSIDKALEDFRAVYRADFGNGLVNTIISDGRRAATRTPLQSNPFGVVEKRLPVLGTRLHTTVYNSLVLVVMGLLLSLASLASLKLKLR